MAHLQSIRIGTTPTHTFTLPPALNEENLVVIEITYSQNDQVVLQKNEQECTVTGNTIEVTLSQEDTFTFAPKVDIEIQIRVVTDDRQVHSSDIKCVSCARCLSSEVL